jgi:hypothetical protein
MKTTILFIIIISTKIICGQKDTLIHGILFTIGPTLTDSIQKGLKPNFYTKASQNEETIKKNENKISIYIPLLPYIDVFSGLSYRIGSEIKILRNFSTYIEGGSYFFEQPRASWLENAKGYVGKIGLKLYLNKNKKTFGKYIAVDYLYKFQNFFTSDSIQIANNPSFFKKYEETKYVNAIAIKYGETIILEKRFYVDLYAGIGIRFINSNRNLTTEEENGILSGEGNGGLTRAMVRLKGTLPNINAGIKIGYILKK